MSKYILELQQRYKNSLVENQKIITERNYYFSYTCGLSIELINQLDKKLNPNTYQLLFHVCSKLKFSNQIPDEDSLDKSMEIILNRLKVSLDYNELEWSRATLYRAVKPLVDKGVLIKIDKGLNYVVNPFYFNVLSNKQYMIFKRLIFKVK